MFHNNYIAIASLILVISAAAGFIMLWQNKIRFYHFNLGITSTGNRKLQIGLIVAMITFLFYLDFLRDYVFKNLDWRMDYQYLIENGGSPDKYVDGTDSWMKAVLGDTSSQNIYLLKYLATGCFLMIYGFLSHLVMRFSYPKYNTFPFTVLLYGLGTLAMFLVFSFYFFEWSAEVKGKFYLTSMEIGHFLESSLPSLLSILGFKIYLSSQELKPNE